MTITHPDTGRTIGVKTFAVDAADVTRRFTSGEWHSAKDVSWHLLNQPKSIALMEETDGGESSHSNFALSVLENALDWRLGMAVCNLITACAKMHKRPKPFRVAVARNGDLYLIMASGRVIPA